MTPRTTRLFAAAALLAAVGAAALPAHAQGSNLATLAVAGKLDALTEKGGSDEWDVAVRRILVSAFDADRSGAIDGREVPSVPCAVVKRLDAAIRSGRHSSGGSLMTTYGFPELSSSGRPFGYVGAALGFSPAARAAAASHFASCGMVR